MWRLKSEGRRRPRGRAGHLLCIAFCALPVTMLVPALVPALVPVEAASEASESKWLDLRAGLTELRKEQRLAIVRYVGQGARPESHYLDAYLKSASLARKSKKLLRIELTPADLVAVYPPPAAGRPAKGGPPGRKPAKGGPAKKAPLPPGQVPPPPGQVGPPPAGLPRAGLPLVGDVWRIVGHDREYLIVDFRERVVRRYENRKKPPSRNQISSEWGRLLERNDLHVKQDAVVSRILFESEHLFRAGKVRDAVMKIVAFDNQRERNRMDPVLRLKVEKAIRYYRDRGRRILQQGDDLILSAKQNADEYAEKLSDAIRAFDRAKNDYPFADIKRHANRQKGVVASLLQQSVGL